MAKRKVMAEPNLSIHEEVWTDSRGKKKVWLDFDEYRELIEDYQDLLAMLEAQDEPPVSLDEAERILKRDGIL